MKLFKTKLLSSLSYGANLPKLIVIAGPTASGKTSLAIEIACKFSARGGSALGGKGGEIVSADSRQIYRGMDIGTAKPTPEEMRLIPYYLIDIKNPDEEYTVAEYKKDALEAIDGILEKTRLPVMAGGTGLYIQAVTDNLDIPEVKPNPALRKELETEIKEKGLEHLYRRLIELDPEAAYIVDPRNPRRVIRALEVSIETNKPFTSQRRKNNRLFDALKIGLTLPEEILKKRIESRVQEMVKSGLVEEVENLISKYPTNLPAFDAIGYREIISCLQEKSSLEEAVEQIKKNTWHYARRQMTWFRKDNEIHWESPANTEKIMDLVDNFLSN